MLHTIDASTPVWSVETLAQIRRRVFGATHLAGRVLSASGIATLLLSAIGLFGALALVVAQRTREIGIRIALGSSRDRIIRLIMRDAFALVGVALTVGALAALAIGPTVAHFLYGVRPRDPLAFFVAALIVIGAACMATWLPARRAARVDPLIALRQD